LAGWGNVKVTDKTVRAATSTAPRARQFQAEHNASYLVIYDNLRTAKATLNF
jgi:hypothetical protein